MNLTILGHIEMSWIRRDHEWAKVLSVFNWMGKVCGAYFTIFSSGIAQILPSPYGEASQRDSGVFSSPDTACTSRMLSLYCLAPWSSLAADPPVISEGRRMCHVRSSSWHTVPLIALPMLLRLPNASLKMPSCSCFPSHPRDWTTWPHTCRKVL